MKEIHFYLDKSYCDNPHVICELVETYDETEVQIDSKKEEIYTTSLASITFDLLDLGYRIFVHRNGRILECKLGSMDGTEKEIRRGHNLLRLIMGHVFDRYFEKEE